MSGHKCQYTLDTRMLITLPYQSYDWSGMDLLLNSSVEVTVICVACLIFFNYTGIQKQQKDLVIHLFFS